MQCVVDLIRKIYKWAERGLLKKGVMLLEKIFKKESPYDFEIKYLPTYSEYISKQDYAITFFQENVELFIYSILAFFVPLMLGHPQWLVGAIVNCALVLSALNLRGLKLVPIIVLPSLGALFSGVLFGGVTPTLMYMIPVIWVGNFSVVYLFKRNHLHHKSSKVKTLLYASALKAAILFAFAFIFLQFGLVPVVFLTAMGIMQLATALLGGSVALIIQNYKKQFI